MIDLAYALGQAPNSGGQAGGPMSGLISVLPFVGIFLIFYFLMIRPQQKQKREREQVLANLKRGDRVVTTGGLLGTIVGLNEKTVTLKLADQVKVECLRSAIGAPYTEGGESKGS
ncbi:MAG TPA: preprotein translocase subunit YajC [Methylomirabilota bacterium]|nr:preprotein translocase subunit YajC [Methylomirabilota bacterium]